MELEGVGPHIGLDRLLHEGPQHVLLAQGTVEIPARETAGLAHVRHCLGSVEMVGPLVEHDALLLVTLATRTSMPLTESTIVRIPAKSNWPK